MSAVGSTTRGPSILFFSRRTIRSCLWSVLHRYELCYTPAVSWTRRCLLILYVSRSIQYYILYMHNYELYDTSSVGLRGACRYFTFSRHILDFVPAKCTSQEDMIRQLSVEIREACRHSTFQGEQHHSLLGSSWCSTSVARALQAFPCLALAVLCVLALFVALHCHDLLSRLTVEITKSPPPLRGCATSP